MWMTARASRQGLVELVVGAAGLTMGLLLLRQAGLSYLGEPRSTPRLAAGGMALLVLCGVMAFRIARRREYPWLLALTAVALPFYDPTQAPYDGPFRVVVTVRDLVLILATLGFVAQAMRRADELERRVHFEALAWSNAGILVLLLIQSMAADVLPPLRATWLASAMIGSWVLAWLMASRRYQA